MNKQKYHNQIFNQQKSFFKLILFILLILPIITNFQVISLINGPSSEITQNSYLTSEYYILDNFFGKTSTLLKTLKLEANAVVSDSENNSYFTGVTELDVLHNTEIFVGKMNSSGSVLWINNWRHYEKNYANDLTIDEANNQLFIIGETVKNTSQSYSDILLSCINYTTGMEIWNTTIGDTSFSEQGKSIFYFENKLYIAAIQTKYFQIYSEPNIMLLCVNSTDGAIIWEQTFDNSYNDLYASLAFDALDEMFYLSFTRENRTTTPYQYNYFLQKFNLTGNLIWSRTADSYLSPRILDVKISPYNQQIYLVGDCYESISSSYKDGLIISYNSQGEIL
ncbi:MAG: hypothetical protein FK734_10135, partial [Asgard group archaeon]|nr:hypothetical protein [Asgard group archaeon]